MKDKEKKIYISFEDYLKLGGKIPKCGDIIDSKIGHSVEKFKFVRYSTRGIFLANKKGHKRPPRIITSKEFSLQVKIKIAENELEKKIKMKIPFDNYLDLSDTVPEKGCKLYSDSKDTYTFVEMEKSKYNTKYVIVEERNYSVAASWCRIDAEIVLIEE